MVVLDEHRDRMTAQRLEGIDVDWLWRDRLPSTVACLREILK